MSSLLPWIQKCTPVNPSSMHVSIQPVRSLSSSGHKTGIVMPSGRGDADHGCDVARQWIHELASVLEVFGQILDVVFAKVDLGS